MGILAFGFYVGTMLAIRDQMSVDTQVLFTAITMCTIATCVGKRKG